MVIDIYANVNCPTLSDCMTKHERPQPGVCASNLPNSGVVLVGLWVVVNGGGGCQKASHSSRLLVDSYRGVIFLSLISSCKVSGTHT